MLWVQCVILSWAWELIYVLYMNLSPLGESVVLKKYFYKLSDLLVLSFVSKNTKTTVLFSLKAGMVDKH
jgi:hypothetical protein